MTPTEKVEALLRKTVAAGCPVGEVIAANETAVRLAIKYHIPSTAIRWPGLPTGYRWEGQNVVPVVVAPAPQQTPKARVVWPKPAAPQPQRQPQARAGTKAAMVLAALNTSIGTAVSVDQIMAMTGWQPHTVRGWVSLQNKSRKVTGLPPIQSTRNRAGELVYFI